MDSKGGLCGRLAILCNLVSRPELNGQYVLILDYSFEKERFHVQSLPLPNGTGDISNLWLKEDCLQLCTKNRFSERYLDASEVRSMSIQEAAREPDGTIQVVEDSQHIDGVLFTNSHRIVGDKVNIGCNGIPVPVTTVFENVHVAPNDDDATLEIEDVLFCGDEIPCSSLLTCTKGRCTTFRRCSFYCKVVVVAGDDSMIDLCFKTLYQQNAQSIHTGSPNAVFENCIFDFEAGPMGTDGVRVGRDGTATFLNCVFRNVGFGVGVYEGGKASLIHCTIENALSGVQAMEKAVGISMLNCSVRSCQKAGIVLERTGPAVLRGCKIEHCAESGVLVRGGTKSVDMSIGACNVSNCYDGIYFEIGKVAARIDTSMFTANRRYALAVLPSLMGSIELHGCSSWNNAMGGIANDSHAECRVTVNGQIINSARAEMQPPPIQLGARRCYQQAGLCDINCLNCGRKEEPREKFKKCGQCENVCYCSKECQKAHWKEHKKDCKPACLP